MKILTIGDSCEDYYIYCSSERFCPDAPVPVLNPISKVKSLGMVGNVADNLKSLGVDVDIISNFEKIKKIRYVDERTNHMFVRIDEGENKINRISNEILGSIEWGKFDAIIVSDYNKGFLLEEDIEYISKKHPLTFLDSKKQINGFANDFSFIKINNIEYNKSQYTIPKTLLNKLIITLGPEGAMYQNKIFKVKQVDVRDTSGAGDTFLAGLTYSYVLEQNINKAIDFANQCASQVVQKKGTAKINLKEL
jgi:bifunctional ADP-heptose synthase (sugar kinase/adenylyltransferase)